MSKPYWEFCPICDVALVEHRCVACDYHYLGIGPMAAGIAIKGERFNIHDLSSDDSAKLMKRIAELRR